MTIKMASFHTKPETEGKKGSNVSRRLVDINCNNYDKKSNKCLQSNSLAEVEPSERFGDAQSCFQDEPAVSILHGSSGAASLDSFESISNGNDVFQSPTILENKLNEENPTQETPETLDNTNQNVTTNGMKCESDVSVFQSPVILDNNLHIEDNKSPPNESNEHFSNTDPNVTNSSAIKSEHDVTLVQVDSETATEQTIQTFSTTTTKINDTTNSTYIPKPTKEYSTSTQLFLDLLDLATGKKPKSGYSILKDRISTLMKNANKKKYTSHGAYCSGIGVNDAVDDCEKRNVKQVTPEPKGPTRIMKKHEIIPLEAQAKKSTRTWQNNVPAHDPNSTQQVHTTQMSTKKAYSDQHSNSFTDLKMESSTALPEIETYYTAIGQNANGIKIYFPREYDNKKYKNKKKAKLSESEISVDDDEYEFSSLSINSLLASQFENAAKELGVNEFFMEEECLMLSPYSNEAKLYKLLFPGQKIPIYTGEVTSLIEAGPEESTQTYETHNLMTEKCKTETVNADEINETATVDGLTVLTSPEAKPKKQRRKKPEKKKKVYDRSFVKAVQTNNDDLVESMLMDGGDPDTSCSIGTVLHYAAQFGYTLVVDTLLWGGSDTEIRNELGDTALHLAATSGHGEIVMALATHGCDVDAGNNYDITPLHMALTYGRLSVIQILVRMNADPECPDKMGDTPQTIANQLGYPDSVLDPDAANNGALEEIPPHLQLIDAIERKNLDLVCRCLEKKASPDTIVPLALHWPAHSTVLHRSAHLGLNEIVKALIDAGANIHAQDIVGNTPLHAAVQDANDAVIRILLKAKADINKATQSGVTPLHRAAMKGHKTTVMLLLNRGADVTIMDHQKRTPMDWAREKGYGILARKMLSYI